MNDSQRDELLVRIDERVCSIHANAEKDEARLTEHLRNHWWKIVIICGAFAGLGSAAGVFAK